MRHTTVWADESEEQIGRAHLRDSVKGDLLESFKDVLSCNQGISNG